MRDDVDEHMASTTGGADVVLRTFAVRARFRRPAPSAALAQSALRAELIPVAGLYDDLVVEPQEPDGRWAVDVRFVVTSLDGELAVRGVSDSLCEVGLVPDETWLAERLP